MSRRCLLRIGGTLLLVCFSSGFLWAQGTRYTGELIFCMTPEDPNYTINVSATAASGKTRWEEIGDLALPTEDCGSLNASCQGNEDCGFNSPDSPGDWDPMAWAKYTFTFECSQGFTRHFTIDFRDRNWQGNYSDLCIWYFKNEGELKYEDASHQYHVISEDDELEIWTIFNNLTPNKTDLLVPDTTTNDFTGGQIKFDGGTYDTPKTVNLGWTTYHTFEAISPQTVSGKKYVFRKWSDGNSSLNRSLTVDDHHDFYYYTAEFWNAYMSGPSYLDEYEVGTFTAHPADGTAPYDYTWYRMELGGEPRDGIDESEGDGIRRPPVGRWVHLDNFDGSQTAVSSGVSPGFKMRVVVEDDDDNSITVDKTIAVGEGRSEFSRDADQHKTTGTAMDNLTPSELELFPNYPNPFNPVTTIQYNLSEDAYVSLVVYDLRGKEVARLVDGEQAAGYKTVTWDASDVGSGIYFYRIRVMQGNKVVLNQTGKMMLVK